MKYIVDKIKYNGHYRYGFYIFILVLFVIIAILEMITDSELVEYIIYFLFVFLGFNVGLYIYIEEKERKVRLKNHNTRFND